MGVYAPVAAFEPRTDAVGLSRLDRKAVEAQIEGLIALLDRFDGDPDLEDDDPSGDPLDIDGEHPTDTGQTLLPTLPIYGIDHTRGPINEREACRAWDRAIALEGAR